jgi:uncharacterized protein YdgA (DUF945 family)
MNRNKENKMKKVKLAVGVIAVLGLTYVGTAWYTGNVIENGLDSTLKNLCEKMNYSQDQFFLNITHANDEKGIFSTKTHIKITVEAEEGLNSITLFDDDVIIHHGPFPVAALKHGVFSPQKAWIEFQTSEQSNPNLWKRLDNQPFAKGFVSVSYFNNMAINMSTQPVVLSNKDEGFEFLNGELELGAFNYHASSDLNFENGSSSIEVNKINYQEDNDKQIKLTNLKLTGWADYQKANLNFQMNFDDFYVDLKSNKTDEIAIKNFAWHYKLDADSNGINANVNLAVGQFDYGKQSMGNGALELNFEGISKSLIDITHPFFNKIKSNLSPRTVINVKKAHWHNAAGDINASLLMDISNLNEMTLFKIKMIHDTDPINQLKLNLEAPYKVIAHILTQYENYDNKNISDELIAEKVKAIQSNIEGKADKSPVFVFKKDGVEGVFSNIEFSKKTGEFIINGKKISSNEYLNNF